MTQYPRFTILFPTRERADVLFHSLRTAVEQDYPNLEIIVCDNNSRDNTRSVVESFRDKRIRYINPGQRLSMTHNWEFGLSHVNSEWVTILGDDDAILPGSLRRVAAIAAITGLKAIRAKGCSYRWPSLTGSRFGTLSIHQKCGFEIRRTDHWLSKVMSGQANYSVLPILYNGGFTHMSIIDQARSITGEFFRSMTPDVYSAIAIANLTEEYVFCHEPLAINGASAHSTGSSMFRPIPATNAQPTASMLFLSENNIPFHSDLSGPNGSLPPQSIQALVYEAYLQALPLTSRRVSSANHAEQARLILTSAGEHCEGLAVWLLGFCALHDLPYPTAKSPFWQYIGTQCRWLSTKWESTNTFVLKGSLGNPLENVYDASMVAACVKNETSSRVCNLCRRLFNRIRIPYRNFAQ